MGFRSSCVGEYLSPSYNADRSRTGTFSEGPRRKSPCPLGSTAGSWAQVSEALGALPRRLLREELREELLFGFVSRNADWSGCVANFHGHAGFFADRRPVGQALAIRIARGHKIRPV